MKNFALILLFFCSALPVRAAILGAPYIPEIDARFDALEEGQTFKQGFYPQGSVDGHYVKQVAKATYDYSVEGVTAGATGSYSLGVSIPKNAVIVRGYYYVITKPTTSSSGTLGFYCGNSTTPELLQSTAAASFVAAGLSGDMNEWGAASAFTPETTSCNLSAKVATGALTAGKVVFYVEYVVHQ